MQRIYRVLNQQIVWVSSEIIDIEVAAMPDTGRRIRIQRITTHATEHVSPEELTFARGFRLQSIGFSGYDALHLACAEFANVDLFLTTDDRLVRLAERHKEEIELIVRNPLAWVSEVS